MPASPPVTTRLDLDEQRWEAVRTSRSDGGAPFYYAVTTTGVFCRPECRSRLPKRRNVVFFDTIDEAKAAGFRPCLRCHPDDDGGPHDAAIRKACRRIEQSEQLPDLDELARIAGLSPSRFRRAFRQALGVTPKQYAQGMRRSRLQTGLPGSESVTRAIYDAGFNASSRVYEQTDALLGMSPSEFRRGGSNQAILYATGECDLGRVLVAVTERGVCAIELGDDDHELVGMLTERFSEATIADDDTIRDLLDQVISLIERPSEWNALPLDIQGTAFQQRVWEALRSIPAGETRSYREIAVSIGKPSSVRAVAGACAGNRLAVAIPCHRAIASDGRLTGYRWGLDRKRALTGTRSRGHLTTGMVSSAPNSLDHGDPATHHSLPPDREAPERSAASRLETARRARACS